MQWGMSAGVDSAVTWAIDKKIDLQHFQISGNESYGIGLPRKDDLFLIIVLSGAVLTQAKL